MDQQGPLGEQLLLLLRGVRQEYVEHAPHGLGVHIVPVILDPADGPVPPDDAVLHIVQVVPAGGHLVQDALFHRLQVLRKDQAPEGAPGHFPELRHVGALEDAQQAPVGVQDLLFAVRAVDQEAAGHFVHEIYDLTGRLQGLSVQAGECLRRPRLSQLAERQAAGPQAVQKRQNMIDQGPSLFLHNASSLRGYENT